MAVIVRTVIDGADQAAHDQLQEALNGNIDRAGGPPAGLMAHIGHQDDEGLAIVEVFNNEDGFHAWWAEIVAPALAASGLSAGPHDVRTIWSFARP